MKYNGPQLLHRLSIVCLASMFIASSGCNGATQRLASMNPFRKAKSPAEMIAQKKKDAASKSDPDPLALDQKVEVNADVFVANGRLWESTGNTAKAMENYTKALQKDPSNAEALGNVARIQFREGNYEKAEQFFSKASVAKPEDAGLHNDLGLTLSKLGKHQQAVHSLDKALELAPGTSRYANNLASVKYEMGDRTGAFKTLSMGNQPAVAHFNMAFLAQKHGHLQDARQHLSSAIEMGNTATDTATKKAVMRSQSMLASLNGGTDPTKIASKPSDSTGAVSVTSSAGAPNGSVRPAAGLTGGNVIVQPTGAQQPFKLPSDPPTTGAFVMPPGMQP